MREAVGRVLVSKLVIKVLVIRVRKTFSSSHLLTALHCPKVAGKINEPLSSHLYFFILDRLKRKRPLQLRQRRADGGGEWQPESVRIKLPLIRIFLLIGDRGRRRG